MSSPANKLPITAAQYLEGELRFKFQHELVNSHMYAPTGTVFRHREDG